MISLFAKAKEIRATRFVVRTEVDFFLQDGGKMNLVLTRDRWVYGDGRWNLPPVTHEIDHGCFKYWSSEVKKKVLLPLSNFKSLHVSETSEEEAYMVPRDIDIEELSSQEILSVATRLAE